VKLVDGDCLQRERGSTLLLLLRALHFRRLLVRLALPGCPHLAQTPEPALARRLAFMLSLVSSKVRPGAPIQRFGSKCWKCARRSG